MPPPHKSPDTASDWKVFLSPQKSGLGFDEWGSKDGGGLAGLAQKVTWPRIAIRVPQGFGPGPRVSADPRDPIPDPLRLEDEV